MRFVLESKNIQPCAPNLFGLFFEDINHSLDGLLNANLVQNAWFDFSYFTYGEPKVVCKNDFSRFWELTRGAAIDTSNPIHKNRPNSLVVCGENVVFKNLGYDFFSGQKMFVSAGKYVCEFFYKAAGGAELEVGFEFDGEIKDSVKISLEKSKGYKKVSLSLSAAKSGYAKLAFKVTTSGANFVGFSLVNEKYLSPFYGFGKLKSEVVNALDIGAKFLRFPGGCLVEGDVSTDYLYDWETTIGPLEERKSKPSVWEYLQSNEIGFFEYFCLCERLGLLPVPVHHVGLICQIRTGVQRGLRFIRLDPKSAEFKRRVTSSVAHLVYFALGDPDSADSEESMWAKKRAEMGHKKPFNLRYVALGNENWGKEYFENFEACLSGIKNYPYAGEKVDLVKKFGLTILSTVGVDINPQDSNPSWVYLNKTHTDLIVDEHVYNTPEWFIDNYPRYDYYDKRLSKVFMGEYACHTNANGEGALGGENNFVAAMCEAVFMLGMENNPDIVKLSCYAPLLNKIGSTNWVPDLIHFDGLKENETPSLAVQKMFMKYHGTKVAKLGFEKDLKNAAKISFSSKNNSLKLKEIASVGGKKLTFKEGTAFEDVVLTFGHNVGDELKFTFEGECKTTFKIFIDHGHAYYEKRFGGKRMTLEDLGEITLESEFKIAYEKESIKILDSRGKVLKQKHIWTSRERVFANATFDKSHMFVKAINISNKPESFELILDEKLNLSKIEATKITLTDSNGTLKREEGRVKGNKVLVDKLEPMSINFYILNL